MAQADFEQIICGYCMQVNSSAYKVTSRTFSTSYLRSLILNT